MAFERSVERSVRAAATAGPATRADRPPRAGPTGGLEAVQRLAGNAAAVSLVQGSRHVQRLAEGEGTLPPIEVGFSAEELEWIDEVWHDPAMQLMVQAYGELPQLVLERVAVIVDDETGKPAPKREGVFDPLPEHGDADIEIGDAAYEVADPGDRPRSAEEEFKGTLIHELFHYIDEHTHDVDGNRLTTPDVLKLALCQPDRYGFPRFAFGWFLRPTGVFGYLGDVEIWPTELSDGSTVLEGSPEAQAKQDGAYEKSPDSRNPEEDLATSVAMFLTSPALRKEMELDFPQRFKLVNRYFKRLAAQVQAQAGRG
jgi:hypothetical protein